MFSCLLFILALSLFWHFLPVLVVLHLLSLALRSRALPLRRFKTNKQTNEKEVLKDTKIYKKWKCLVQKLTNLIVQYFTYI